MKYIKLRDIVRDHAYKLKESAEHSGAWNDGGCSSLLKELSDFHQSLVIKYDLRPSESGNLNDVEVGEPIQFEEAIHDYKMKLVNEMEL